MFSFLTFKTEVTHTDPLEIEHEEFSWEADRVVFKLTNGDVLLIMKDCIETIQTGKVKPK